MAEFNVNSSRDIPSTACADVKCDSAGENCYCPTDSRSGVPSPFNPLLPILQVIGAFNTAGEIATGNFGNDQAPELSAPSSPDATEQINAESYDQFSLAFPEPPVDWSGGLFSAFGSGDSSTPEQRGQFAAQNIAANVTGNFPSVPAVDNYGAIFDNAAPTSFSLEGTFTSFTKE